MRASSKNPSHRTPCERSPAEAQACAGRAVEHDGAGWRIAMERFVRGTQLRQHLAAIFALSNDDKGVRGCHARTRDEAAAYVGGQ